ncbi:MAG: AAA family ATPase, partial [Muribaculaceae bacterium]
MSETVNIRELNDLIASKSSFVNLITQGMDQTIIGQKHLVDSLLIALLANGHVLLEGVPGLAKTLAIKTLASLIDAKYSRIQFTPDLLPADVIGTMIYSVQKEKFEVKKGPIFANFVLADEINRAPAKVQSALLEAMQERQVTISDNTYKLDNPFLVLATQNPIEQEGTYPLPEAQVDRFLMKVVIGYPNKEEEKLIIRQNIQSEVKEIKSLLSIDEIIETRKVVQQIYIDEKIEKYIVDIVFATRFPADFGLNDLTSIISFGASPRASISLALAARAFAFLKGRGYV